MKETVSLFHIRHTARFCPLAWYQQTMKYDAGCCNYAGFVRNVCISDWVFIEWFTFHWRIIFFLYDFQCIIPAQKFNWSNKGWSAGSPQGVLNFQSYFVQYSLFHKSVFLSNHDSVCVAVPDQGHLSNISSWNNSFTPLIMPACYVQTTVTSQNCACCEINNRLNSVNSCFYSIQNTRIFSFYIHKTEDKNI